MSTRLPRGVRLNNPGNIRYVEGITSTYQGCVGSDGAFCQFDTPHHGLRAACKLLLTYQDRHGLRTVRGIINRWAPPVENDTSAYVTAVAAELGVDPDEDLDLHREVTLERLVTAVVRHENGQQPYAQEAILAATRDALGYAYVDPPVIELEPDTQAAGPLPEPQQETVMPEETPSFDWSALAKIGGAIASIFNPAVGIAITALSPLLQEKITKTVAKHSADPKVATEIGTQLTGAIMDTAKRLTGKSDDLEAVAAMRKDPAVIAAVESAVTTKLDEMAPFLDKLHAISKEEWAAESADRAAAAERARGDQFDMAGPLLYASIGGVAVITVFVGAVIVVQMVMGDGKVGTELWAALTGLIGWITAKAGTIYDYRFGTSRQSAAKDVLIGELSRR